MSQIHKTLLTKYKRDIKLPSSGLSYAEHCSNKLIELMTNDDKNLIEVKTALQMGFHWKNLERI